jgi:hypothetical protein
MWVWAVWVHLVQRQYKAQVAITVDADGYRVNGSFVSDYLRQKIQKTQPRFNDVTS